MRLVVAHGHTFIQVQRGAKVVISARRTEELNRVKQSCKGKYAEEVLVLPLDLLAYATHAAAVAKVIHYFGHIDILINNGGRSQRALVETTDLDVDRAMLELNVLGTISLTKQVLPAMLARHQGQIVTVSSVAGKMPAPVSGSYTMSKHALQGFFDTLRLETADRGLVVTNICPGPVATFGSQNAFTGTPGQRVGEFTVEGKRLTTERCAELMAGTIYARRGEAWISLHPILLFLYVNQFMPEFARRVGRLAARKRIAAFLAGNKYGKDFVSTFKFFSVLRACSGTESLREVSHGSAKLEQNRGVGAEAGESLPRGSEETRDRRSGV